MLTRQPTRERFFVVTSVTAIGIALVAAAVNVVVGPINPAMWLVPVFMAGYAAITFVLVQAVVQQAEDPKPVNWMVRRLIGKRVVYLLRWLFRWNTRLVSPVFLYFVPSFLLLLAVLLLIFSVRGEISGGEARATPAATLNQATERS